MDDIDKFLQSARDSINEYCIDFCKGECCKIRFIKTRNLEEVKAVFGVDNIDKIRDDRLDVKEYLIGDDCEYVISLTPCSSLVDDKCRIYYSGDRPIQCKQYPLRKDYRRDIVYFSPTCTAVKNGLFENVFDELLEMRFEIVK